jgi:hypothetical protein
MDYISLFDVAIGRVITVATANMSSYRIEKLGDHVLSVTRSTRRPVYGIVHIADLPNIALGQRMSILFLEDKSGLYTTPVAAIEFLDEPVDPMDSPEETVMAGVPA